jgi:DNA-3-methyladenine glycosylase
VTARKAAPLSFFRRRAADVAKDLVGMTLVRTTGEGTRRFVIVETEAYEGVHDLASHSSRGRTARTEVMFGPPGRLYIYRVYGLHWMLNIVTGEIDEGAAVLIRAVQGLSGPGRVAQRLEVDASLNARPANRATGLWFEFASTGTAEVECVPRIGVDYSGPYWAQKKLRFKLIQNRASGKKYK